MTTYTGIQTLYRDSCGPAHFSRLCHLSVDSYDLGFVDTTEELLVTVPLSPPPLAMSEQQHISDELDVHYLAQPFPYPIAEQ